MSGRPAALVFDVNETLLDLSPLRQGFEAVFGTNPPLGEWFARLLHGSLVANSLGQYRPFAEIGSEALAALAARYGLDLSSSDAQTILAQMTRLPPHPDVVPALERIAEIDIEMVALTNGDQITARSQITNAGLGGLLTRVLSVDAVRRFKPDPAPYLHAARELDVEIKDTMLVAAHDWDVAGAMTAGARGAFVSRAGARWGLPGERPEMIVGDLDDLASRLIS